MNALTRTLAWHVGVPLVTLLHRVGACSCLFALRGFERLRWQLGRFGAWGRYEAARRSVPAYRNFVGANRATRIDDVPQTDKVTYVKAYDLEARCEGGRLPASGVIIDESSGSSGVPTNWVRGVHERETNRRTIRLGLQRRLGNGPLFFINAFALGPWATGINLTLSLSSWGRVKSLGPDIEKIGNTLRQFGPDVHYVIMGYPPFLKQLVDQLDVDWDQYEVSMIFGGEGMSESMRRYLQATGIRRVFGSYGASDLELNIAAETEFTIALRRHLEANPRLRRRLLRHPGATPMVFQFNPADFFVETASTGELLVTVCRPGHLTPKVRYNIHDLGHVMRWPEVAAVLRAEGIDPDSMEPGGLDLPLLFLYGRSDASVAYYGCKISPADIQEALFRVPELAAAMDAHQLEVLEDDAGDKRLLVHLEVAAGAFADGLIEWSRHFFDALAAVNQDFRESRRMAPAAKAPRLVLHAQGAGPFTGADIRIKRQYVAAPAA
jgi:phenylacetate-CoA ligase